MTFLPYEDVHVIRLVDAIALTRTIAGCNIKSLDEDQRSGLERVVTEMVAQVPDDLIERIAPLLHVDAKYYDGLNYGGSPTKVREPASRHGWYIINYGGTANYDGFGEDGDWFNSRLCALRRAVLDTEVMIEGINSTPDGSGLLRLP